MALVYPFGFENKRIWREEEGMEKDRVYRFYFYFVRKKMTGWWLSFDSGETNNFRWRCSLFHCENNVLNDCTGK